MDEPLLFHDQLLATKFFVPTSSHRLIARPQLTTLLDQSLRRKLTLISAPAGFGKTTLLSTWVQSFPQEDPEAPHVAWVSLDEGDNEPVLFWTYVLTALDTLRPGLCTPLLAYLQTQQAPTPPLRYVLQALINNLASRTEQFFLVFDDYHVITQPDVHNSLTYLVEHLPPQLHIILATRADPPLAAPSSESTRGDAGSANQPAALHAGGGQGLLQGGDGHATLRGHHPGGDRPD